VLQLEGINVYYGGIHALKDVNLNIKENEIVAMIGANGAGKTTTLKAISGIQRPKSGKIKFNNNDITNLPPQEIVKLGISHVPEGRRVFPLMTVTENLEMGAFTRKDKLEIKKDFENVFSLFPRLLERKNQLAGTLSGGEQQMLAIGRALMSRPKLLILDEPSMGLAPIIVKEIFSIIKDINSKGTTILLVEQNANMALQAANRAYIIKTGEVELEGKAEDLLNDENIKKAYLGG
jgi:branched-chain amino acid transport system ATP-binding protein